MNCKYCGTAIPSKTSICPSCGRMASKEQMAYFKEFNKENNIKNAYQGTTKYEKSSSNNSKLGMLIIPVIILVIIIIALIKVLGG